MANRFAIDRDASLYHQSMIQYVRADVSRDLLDSMTGNEITDSRLFEMPGRAKEKKLLDPDNVYAEVRRRKAALAGGEKTSQELITRVLD